MNIQKQQRPELFISCLKAMTLQLLFKQALNNLFSDKYFNENKSNFANGFFIFQIKRHNRSWSVIKDNQQIIKFLKNQSISATLAQNTRQSLQTYEKLQVEEQAILFEGALGEAITVKAQVIEQPFFEENRQGYGKFLMKKRSGGRYRETNCCKFGAIFKGWKQREVAIFLKGVAYYNEKAQIREFLSFSQGFFFQFGKPDTGLEYGITLYANHRRLSLQAKSIKDFLYFLFTLRNACKQSCYMSLNRFNSFAPIRYSSSAKYFVDGQQYFEQLANSIQLAQKSILMMGWMISPEFLLKRGVQKMSLEHLIQKADANQVKVSIILYFQSCFLSNDSLYTKQKLQKHKNVTVLRHPCGKLPVLWSHHGKLVIIDQQQAFIGGLDLCYGRYDSSNHELFPDESLYPGLQHNNIRKNDQMEVRTPAKSNISKQQCRLPWHDVAQCVKGDVVTDLTHHFYQLWNFIRYQNCISPHDSYAPSLFQVDTKSVFSTKVIPEEPKQSALFRSIGNKLTTLKVKGKRMVESVKKQIHRIGGESEISQNPKIRFSATQDYFQKYVKQVAEEIAQKQKGIQKLQKKRSTKQRGHSGSRSKRYSADQIKEIKQGIQHYSGKAGQEKRSNSFLLSGDKIIDFMSIEINKDYVQCLERVKERRPKNQLQQKINEIDSDVEESEKMSAIKGSSSTIFEGRDQCQMVRSVGNWSIGCHSNNTQFSIHLAYLQLISQAKHYIYIENQFFISSLANPKNVQNQVALALYFRIKKAILADEKFLVYIILPLIPGFSGDLEHEECLLLRKEMQWQYDTICRGPESLWQRLLSHTNDPGKYMQFLSLRKHGRLNPQSTPQTEIIYVHSKLMIIDDQLVICGSANINDRSLLGDRDSQLAVITRGQSFVEGKIDGQSTLVSQIAQELRIKLWKQHFGFTDEELIDPLSTELWQAIAARAASNTSLYRRIFACYPDDYMETRKQIEEKRKEANIELYEELKEEIVGNVVQFPLCFLEKQPLTYLMTEKEFYMPTECLT